MRDSEYVNIVTDGTEKDIKPHLKKFFNALDEEIKNSKDVVFGYTPIYRSHDRLDLGIIRSMNTGKDKIDVFDRGD